MKKTIFLMILFLTFIGSGYGQFTYSSEFPVNFKINNVTLGEKENIVNVSGGTPDGKWAVKMTWIFTNLLETKGSGEYTAMAWAQDGENFLSTTVRGIWKRRGNVFDIKHFENGTDGNQLLTTGTFDFTKDTYECIVRIIEN
ncbi:hypothetical protein OAU75_04930 [Flavobacteriaceae bacterium]|nr:hypothetical protein [Flavobacteriaceae bacterium]